MKDEKIALLVAQDIVSIKNSMKNKDYEYICCVLAGDGFKPYKSLSDYELEAEFKERWGDIKGSVEVLELAHKLNEEPIDLLKL